MIASKKINKVYIALRDTHPRNNGAGIEILKEAGIEVIEGILKEEVKRFINQYLIKGKI